MGPLKQFEHSNKHQLSTTMKHNKLLSPDIPFMPNCELESGKNYVYTNGKVYDKLRRLQSFLGLAKKASFDISTLVGYIKYAKPGGLR